ncbi:putative DNA-binding domain-containing protein [Serratia fonticola]|uniref:HvfC/BufC family peptide modification chaperone n=1 Tax=Serratia fonticola TaxID=47917 RepID=UPI001644FE3C|nr:putative DNA-binding domain-containing protein [Serratia fonticola]MBC3252369.1 putative DNA-binding domain-containing protein [Serratia fonticola]
MGDNSAPESLQVTESDFSRCLRAGIKKSETYSSGMLLYWKGIRDSIASVLYSVFPVFCRSLTDDVISEISNAFIMQHQATQPEFHQLATELLLFMRQRPEVLAENQPIIEYEWLLYSLEIDEGIVSPPHIKVAEHLDINNTDIIANPTLRIVSFPFLLKNGEPYYGSEPLEYYYAIYRRHDNVLYHKKLSIIDVQLLLEIGNAVAMAKMLKEKVAKHLTTLSFKQWLAITNNDEMISLIIKG